MGFFDGLTKTWTNWGTNWGDLWDRTKSGASDLYHGFLTEAATALNVAQLAWNRETGDTSQDPWAVLSQDMTRAKQGLGQMAGGAGGVLGAAGSLPVIRQIGESSMWGSKELVSRPTAAFYLQTGDAWKNGNWDNLFSGGAWRSAYNSSRSVTAGQAFLYNAMSADLSLGKAIGITPQNEPGFAKSIQKWGGIYDPLSQGPEGFDPRTTAGQALYHTNPWLKASSGTMDAGIMVFGDPLKGVDKLTKAGKLRFVSKPVSSASAVRLAGDDARWQTHVDSQSYQKMYDFVKAAKSPEDVRRTLFNDHYSGGVMANALWSVSDDPQLYNTTFRTFYGDQNAWDELAKEATRLAQLTGTKFANYSISQVSKNVGVGDPLADYVASNKVETDVQAFADAIASGKGFWGRLAPGGKALNLLEDQNTPALRLTSKWRAGVNQWLQYGPNTVLGQWSTDGSNAAYKMRLASRTLLPSSRGGRFLDLNNPDSLRVFTNSLQQSRLSPGQVDNFASMYARASTAESRFMVANQAEDAAFRVHALAHGITPAAIDVVLPTLNHFRSGNRTFVRANKRFISSDARRLGETMAQQGNDAAAMGLTDLADNIDAAVDQGRWPRSHVAVPDEDGNLNLIPLDSTPDASKPLLESQYADALPLQDWGALDSALWWQNRNALGRALWSTKEATTALMETAASLWKITAIMRPGYIWRTLSDEAGGPLAVMGAGGVMPAATEGAANAWKNMYAKAQLVPEYVASVKARSAAGRLRNKARGAQVQGSVVDEAPGSADGLSSHGNDPNYTAYTFGNTNGYTSFDRALASGTLGVQDFMNFLLAHGEEGQLPHDYQMIYGGLKDGTFTKKQAQDLAVDHALANAGMNAYDNPAWQQSVIQAAIDARKPKPTSLFTAPPGESDILGTEARRDVQYAAHHRFELELQKFEPGTKIPDQGLTEEAVRSWLHDHPGGSGLTTPEPTINAALRGKTEMTPKLAQYRDALDKVIAASPVNQDVVLYHGFQHGINSLPKDWRDRDLTGFSFHNEGYTPFSATPDGADQFVGKPGTPTATTPDKSGLAIRMAAPKGSHALSIVHTSANGRDDIGEMLLPRGMSFTITKDWGEDKEGVRWLDVEPHYGPTEGEAALNSVPAKLSRAPQGHYGNYEGEGLSGPEGMGSVRALSEYEGVEYQETNGLLRGTYKDPITGQPATGHEDFLQGTPERVAEIDKTMRVSRLLQDAKLYRTVRFGAQVFGRKAWYGHLNRDGITDLDEQDRLAERWEGGERPSLVGVRFHDKAYSSTTADPKVAEDFGKRWKDANSSLEGEPILMSIEAPKGTGAVQLAPWGHAAEVLLQRNLTYEVVADNGVSNGYRRLDVRVVNPHQADIPNKAQGVPGQPIVIDPRTGTSPRLQPQQVNHLFSLGSAHVFPADPRHIDEVNKFVHANMDDLLRPSSLLHAYVQPDGNMALSVARYTGGSELSAIKPSSGRRVSLGGVKGKTYRGAGESGYDIRFGPGESDYVHVRGAFEGPEGDRFRSQVSSRGPTANMTDRITNSQHARLMANTPGEWTNLTVGMKGYESSWERAANMQLGNDQLARKFIADPPHGNNPGFTVRDAVAWMHNTTEGRAYQARMGAWQSKYYEQIHQVQAMVDTYLPFNENEAEASDALRKAVLKREARYGDLAKVVSEDDMPQIHGASLEQATGRGWFSQKAREITDKTFGLISDMPNDKLLRFPFANNRYRFHVDNLVQSRAKWLDSKGDAFTQADLDAVEGLARDRTLVDARRYLYDTMASHDLAKGLRLLIPFGSALADSAQKWGVVLREKPQMASNIWKIWSAPDRSGMVQDQDGNHLEVKDGKEIWYKLDPKTGQRTDLPDYKPNGKVVVFRLPMGGPTIDGARMPMAINKTAFQTFLDIPTFGPLVTIPANKFAMSHPEFATNKLVQTFILPYGATNSPLTAAIPGNVRNWRDAIDSWRGVDNQNAEEQAMAVYMTEMVNYSQGKRTNAPTFEESRSKAAKMQMMRFMSRLGGVSGTFQSPYQPYIDYYRQLQQQDPGNADQNFYNQMGEEYFWLTAAVTRNALGIPATVGAFNQYKKFSDLMQKFPDLAPLISGAEGAGAFNKAVYEAQKSTPIRYGTQKNERELVPLLESIQDTQKRLGWVKWGQFNDALLADLSDRGLTNLQQKGAEDLLAAKQAFVDNNMTWRDPYGSTQISPWYQDYTSQDTSKMAGRITQMEQIIQDPRLQGRGDIRGLIEYLDARQGFTQYMDLMDVKTLNTPSTISTATKKTRQQKLAADLTSQWNEYVFNLKAGNPQFAALYDRWLSADDKLDARGLQ